METIFVLVILFALGTVIYLAMLLRGAQRDLREVATEAILASRAHSAEELAQASSHAHWMRVEREQGFAKSAPGPVDAAPNVPDKVQLADGTILNVMRPFG